MKKQFSTDFHGKINIKVEIGVEFESDLAKASQPQLLNHEVKKKIIARKSSHEEMIDTANVFALVANKAIDAGFSASQIRFMKYLLLEARWTFDEWLHFPKSKTVKDLGVGETQLKRLEKHFIDREIIEKGFRRTAERKGKIGGQKGLHYRIRKKELMRCLN